MTWAAAAFVVVGFLAIAQLLRIPARASAVIARSRAAVGVLRDSAMTDLEKEKAMQGHAKSLLASFFVITLGSAIALAVPVGVVLALDAAGVVEFDAVLDRTLSWQIILGATVLGFAVWFARKGRRA